MKKCNIFVVGGSTGYTSWIENVNLVDSPLKADIVFFYWRRGCQSIFIRRKGSQNNICKQEERYC